jgi:hypothetical protein
MTYAIITDNQVSAVGSARDLWPGVSHPSGGPAADWLAEHNAVTVRSDLPHNPATHFLRRVAPYLLDGDVFNREAAALPPAPPPAPPEARWIEFGLALGQDASMIEFVRAADAANPILERMISGGLLQAAEGNPRTFMAAWPAALAAGLVTPELAAAVQTLASSYDLPEEFVAGLNPEPEPEVEPGAMP